MNAPDEMIDLHSTDWPTLTRQARAAIMDYAHRHAGRWHRLRVTLDVTLRLLPDDLHGSARAVQLPLLVAWLREQGIVARVRAFPHNAGHRLSIGEHKS